MKQSFKRSFWDQRLSFKKVGDNSYIKTKNGKIYGVISRIDKGEKNVVVHLSVKSKS